MVRVDVQIQKLMAEAPLIEGEPVAALSLSLIWASPTTDRGHIRSSGGLSGQRGSPATSM